MTPTQRRATIKKIEEEIPRLRRYARYLAKDVVYADDLVQDCLVRAIDKIDSWQPGTNLRAWLLTILKNVFRNDLRTAGREVSTDPQAEFAVTIAIPAAQEARMAMLEVRDAFMLLSEEHREVLLLVAIEGLKYEEASVVLDVPIGTVRSRLSRARLALRDAVGNSFGDGTEPNAQKGRTG